LFHLLAMNYSLISLKNNRKELNLLKNLSKINNNNNTKLIQISFIILHKDHVQVKLEVPVQDFVVQIKQLQLNYDLPK
jgi:hypothetical protein